MDDVTGLVITCLGAVTGIALSLGSKKHKKLGQGIAAGSIIVGLPITFLGTTGVGSASFSLTPGSQSAVSSLESELNNLKSKISNLSFGQSGGMIDTGD